MSTENSGNEATRSALTHLAEALLKHYAVTRPPVPIEHMLREPPGGLAGVDANQVSFIMEHGLYNHEPRLAMARLLYREISRGTVAEQLFNMAPPPISYTDLKFFARCLLMPSGWMQALTEQGLSIEQIGDYLQVPSYAVVTRLAELGLPIQGNE